MTISDLYRTLFGREGTTKGTDIDMSEHGRIGGVSTGQGFKAIRVLDDVGTPLNPATLENQTNGQQLVNLLPVLRAILYALQNPPYIDKSANAIRNQVQSGTVTTVTTVTNLTNLTNFGSMSADTTFRIQTLNTWAVNVRSLIT